MTVIESSINLRAESNFYDIKNLENETELYFLLDTPFVEDKKDQFEVSFLCDKSSILRVQDKAANCFFLDEPLVINDRFQLTFSLLEGEGNFMAHLSYAGKDQTIKDPMGAFDWKIGLRTIRRDLPCRILAKLVLI
ncbi:MAG: hypothetical protein COT84_07235 [Chlamydiae bacterium CG10_big_fil_rev_8_21_14_0_10_35_9]|nr:MAG: hypothetical protein COT84_07235 [Chlamydiae bacterium CG10_big_fil_rev_8_21_14_0_10_35_9]